MVELLQDSGLELMSISSAKWDASGLLYISQHIAEKPLIKSQNTDAFRKIGKQDSKGIYIFDENYATDGK